MSDHQARRGRGDEVYTSLYQANLSDCKTPLEHSVREFVYAEVWDRPALDRRHRWLVSLPCLAEAGDHARLAEVLSKQMHLGQSMAFYETVRALKLAELRDSEFRKMEVEAPKSMPKHLF